MTRFSIALISAANRQFIYHLLLIKVSVAPSVPQVTFPWSSEKLGNWNLGGMAAGISLYRRGPGFYCWFLLCWDFTSSWNGCPKQGSEQTFLFSCLWKTHGSLGPWDSKLSCWSWDLLRSSPEAFGPTGMWMELPKALLLLFSYMNLFLFYLLEVPTTTTFFHIATLPPNSKNITKVFFTGFSVWAGNMTILVNS